jgi:serine/threonine-protein kinase
MTPTDHRETTEEFARLQRALEGRYGIEREIGRGGMATVYLARDFRHDRLVTVKVLMGEMATSGAERFLREIRFAARLTHPHIVSVHDSGDADGLLYYVMPYVAGESLRARLRRDGALPLPEEMWTAWHRARFVWAESPGRVFANGRDDSGCH